MGAKEPSVVKDRRAFVFLSPTFNATVPIIANDLEGALTGAIKVDSKITSKHFIREVDGHTVAPRENRELEEPGGIRRIPGRENRPNDWSKDEVKLISKQQRGPGSGPPKLTKKPRLVPPRDGRSTDWESE